MHIYTSMTLLVRYCSNAVQALLMPVFVAVVPPEWHKWGTITNPKIFYSYRSQ